MKSRFGILVVLFFVVVCCCIPFQSVANGLVETNYFSKSSDTLFIRDAMFVKLKRAIENQQRVSVDSPVVEVDTAKKHSPQRAALFSAVVPGLGQVYNKQYWKVPVIYAGGTVAGYLIYYNYSVYKNLRKSFRLRKFDEPEKQHEQFTVKTITGDLNVNLENFTDGEILGLQQSYRRDLDLAVLLAFGVYALNIVDAVVFAHLYDFDVSDDLTLRLKPDFNYAHNGLVQNASGGVQPTMQLGLTYRF